MSIISSASKQIYDMPEIQEGYKVFIGGETDHLHFSLLTR